MRKKILATLVYTLLHLNAIQAVGCKWLNNMEIGAEWLYWKSTQSEMVFATAASVTGEGTRFDAPSLQLQTTYESGYRLFAGYVCDCDWKFTLSFTHAPGEGSLAFAFNPDEFATNFILTNYANFAVFELFENPNVFFSNIDVNWKSRLYYLDAGVSKHCSLCNSLDFTPYFGIRGLWMKQDVGIFAANPTPFSFSSDWDAHASGVGFQGRLLASWDMCWGFSLAGSFGASLLYAHVKYDTELRSSLGTTFRGGTDTYKTMPTMESAIALVYAISVAEIHVAWENLRVFETNAFSIPATGSLSAQGLTLGGSIRF